MSYWVFAAFSGVVGILASRNLGFGRSIIGRAMLAFSVGLLLQMLGQILDAFLTASGSLPVFYPSISELGYAGSIIFYVYGAYALARYIGVTPTVKNLSKSKIIWLVPVAMFALSYFTYLQGYDFVGSSTIHVIFDFGYPILQSIYVGLAVFVLIHANNIKGGLLKRPIAFLVVALIFQYIADSYFVYDFNRGVWYAGNLNDYCYLVAYFVLAIAIIYLDQVIKKLRNTDDKDSLGSAQSHPASNTDVRYVELLRNIIKSQEEVIGPLAWTELTEIKNIVVINRERMEFEFLSDPKQAIDDLLENFVKVFGSTALYVAKRNTYRITRNMTQEEIPAKLL